jgi:carbon monoxide dehydrogenase subunit G
MTSIYKEIEINETKQEVWENISDLSNVHKFHPGIKDSYYVGEKKSGPNAIRVCELYPNSKITERVKEWNEGNSYTLEMDSFTGFKPFKNFTGRIDLHIITPKKTLVELTVSYQPSLGPLGKIINALFIKKSLTRASEDILDGLRLYIEQGAEVKNLKTLKELKKAA